MTVAQVLSDLHENQVAFLVITLLELTGYLFPPPARLRMGDSFDYVIIGGGTAGSVIATRLVQRKYNVLVIEAGDDAPFECTLPGLVPYIKNSHVDWNYTTEADGYSFRCQVNEVLDLGVGKMLGGTGEADYMIYSRGHQFNYDEWYEITEDPIWKWENVLPYFMKAENINDTAIKKSDKNDLFGTKGPIGVTRDQTPIVGEILEGFRQAGKEIIPDTDGNRNGYSRGLLTINLGKRQGSGTEYFSQISESHYIATAKNTLATKIIFNKNKTVVGVEVITDENKKIVINARKEVILAAGALKSPQLLMLSGIGPKEQLKKFNIETISDLPVGKNLQDHVAVFIPHSTNKKVVDVKQPPYVFPAGEFVGYAFVNKSACNQPFPDYTVIGKLFNDMEFLLQFCANTYKFQPKMCNKLYKKAAGNQLIVTLLGNLYAYSRGQVLLRSSDPKDSPIIIHPSFSDDRDLNDFVDYLIDYLKVEETEAFKCLGAEMIDLVSPKCDAFKKGCRNYWRCYILHMMISLRGFSGTCAMGCVVDSRLRVRGVQGLRVADASIMPTIVGGTTFNTVVMIGEKASDIIIEDAGPEYNSMKHEKIRKDQIQNLPKQVTG